MNLLRRLLILSILLPLSACVQGTNSFGTNQDCSVASTEVTSLKIYPAQVLLSTGSNFRMVADAKNECGFTVSTAQVNFRLESQTQSRTVTVGGSGLINVTGTANEPVSVLAVLQAAGQGANAPVEPVAATVNVQRGFTINPVPRCVMIFPPGPVEIAEAAGSRQLTAAAYDTACAAIDEDGTPNGNAKQLPGVFFSWRSETPNIATVDTTGLVTVVNPGVAIIVAEPTQGTIQGTRGEVSVIVRRRDGASGSAPVLKVSPDRLLLQVDGVAQVSAKVINAATGESLDALFDFRLVRPGDTQAFQGLAVAELTPLRDSGTIQRLAAASLTGVRAGQTEVLVTVRVAASGEVLPSERILVSGVRLNPQATDWKRADDLPYTRGMYGQRMAEMDGYLFTTGGVIGEGAGSGGFTEDVNRAGLLLGDGVGGGTDLWVKSRTKLAGQSSSAPEQILSEQTTVVNFVWPGNPCTQTVDASTGLLPADCMEILRRTGEQQSSSAGDRVVHYQLQGHAMVAAAGHLYVVGGVDGQVDVCVGLASGQNCQVFTKFSDRTLIGQVDSLTGGVTWSESFFRIPTELGLQTPSGADAEDKGGRFKPALVVYQNKWLYLLGGWNEVKPVGSTLDPIGINRDEIYRAAIAQDGSGNLGDWIPIGHLLEPTNKHAAAIVGDTLVISGGALGQNSTSLDQVSDNVYMAELDPQTGRFVNPAGGTLGFNEPIPWQNGSPLPIPLEYHSMTVVPGDRRLVVAGGDNLSSSSAAVFVSEINTAGEHSIWSLYKDLPHLGADSSGVTAHAATGVSTVEGQAVARVYVSGGGGLSSSSNFNLSRRSETYYMDLPAALP